jgi:hypothetical protein
MSSRSVTSASPIRPRRRGNIIDGIDFDQGDRPADRHVDVPPWSGTHLKLQIDRYVTTSIALIITKGVDRRRRSVPFLIRARERRRHDAPDG